MSLELLSLGGGTGYLKAGFLGFAGSGKTYTSAKLAIGIREAHKLPGPVAMLDTERGAQYIAPMIRAATGQDLLGVQTRALKDAVEFLNVCVAKGASVAIIDSVSHLWRELMDSYLAQVNEARDKTGKSKRTRLEFQDWGPIKAKWGTFSDLYLNAPLHVIICGRAGYEYDYEENDDTGKKELIKTGIKMKTEGEFGYEPSLLVEMARVSAPGDLHRVVRRATVLKDRFGVLDGKQGDNPDFPFFAPHVSLLTPGANPQINMESKTDLGVSDDGDAEWFRERRLRKILSEEISGLLTRTWPGMSAAEKQAKAALVNEVFGTDSWTKIEEATDSGFLRAGLEKMRAKLSAPKPDENAKAIGDHFAAPAKVEPKAEAPAAPKPEAPKTRKAAVAAGAKA